MKFIKFTVIVLFTLSIVKCKGTQFDKTPPFNIIDASYKNWTGGRPGVLGTDIVVKYVSKTNVIFDSIYFQKKSVKLEIKKLNSSGHKYIIGRFNRSTVKSRTDLILHKTENRQIKITSKRFNGPFLIKDNQAIISYNEDGIIKYYKISNIRKQTEEFYP